MTNKIKRISLSKLFYNDKFVMLFSIFVSFILWMTVSSTAQETTIFTVTDIPVNLPELPDGLRYFNNEDIKAEVKISGNKLVVASVTNNDIYITAADVSFVTGPGDYKLKLVPKKSGVKTDYSFESTVTPSSIEVYVDKYNEGRTIEINNKVSVSSVGKDFYASQPLLSNQTVTVSGADSVISRIAEADAEYDFPSDKELNETTSVSVPIVFYDSDGNRIDSKEISTDISSVEATIPVLSVKTVDIVPNIINMPDSLDFDKSRIKVVPSSIKLGIPKDSVDEAESISTDKIDFSTVTMKNNKFSVDINVPSAYRNLDNVENVSVEFDLTNYATKTITLNKINVINVGSNQNVSVSTKNINVTLIGPSSQISSITAANLTGVIDMSDKSTLTGFVEMPVTININSKFSSCWVNGSYTADVNATQKTP